MQSISEGSVSRGIVLWKSRFKAGFFYVDRKLKMIIKKKGKSVI
jgi:hypothetical protein